MPLWWIERDSIAVEAENEVTKQKQREGQRNAEIDRIHGGR